MLTCFWWSASTVLKSFGKPYPFGSFSGLNAKIFFGNGKELLSNIYHYNASLQMFPSLLYWRTSVSFDAMAENAGSGVPNYVVSCGF